MSETEQSKCSCCDGHGLEQGDTLYISADWDGGIGFDYIRNIKYCPVCGKMLPETKRKLNRKGRNKV